MNNWKSHLILLFVLLTPYLVAKTKPRTQVPVVQGFEKPCGELDKDEYGPFEWMQVVDPGANVGWSLINYSCESKSGDDIHGLWFRSSNEKKFRKVGSYDRFLDLNLSPDKSNLLFVCGPGSGEANAFLLPVQSFASQKRAAHPALSGSQVTFEDMDPTGYVDLEAACSPLKPKKYNGRTMMSVAWLNAREVGVLVWARNPDENASWEGTFKYSLVSRKISKVDHLPFEGLDWHGNLKLENKSGFVSF